MKEPRIDTALQMWPHQGRVEQKDCFPQPAGHALLNVPWDTIGLLGCKGTLMEVAAIQSSEKIHFFLFTRCIEIEYDLLFVDVLEG